jgi:hypothetical protein
VLLFALILLLAACTTTIQHPAVNSPDHFAWQLFMEINQPIPDDPQGRVVWEGWALAREVFADPNGTPDWETLTDSPLRELEQFDPMPLQQLLADPTLTAIPEFDPILSLLFVNETRMNRAAFDFIVENELWYVEGQEAMFNRNESIIFPTDAKEVKALWRPIAPEEAHLFHTTTLTNAEGELELYGLTSLHITTKDLPNWFWATWEHVSNPNREAVVPSRDRAGLPAELRGTKWENYVLRGTQIDFVDPTGRPTILASSEIEAGFEATSSCITCHARSTIGPAIVGQEFPFNRLAVFIGEDPTGQFPIGAVGAPDPAWFFDTSSGDETPKYVQLDFVWALIRAQRRNP